MNPEHERILREQWDALPATSIAAQLGVSGVTVGTWARKLGLPAHPRGFRAPKADPAPTRSAAPAALDPLDALVAVYGRPPHEPLPSLPRELVEQLNKMTLAVVRETVVSLVRETVAQIAPLMMEQAIADYTRNIVLSLIRSADPK